MHAVAFAVQGKAHRWPIANFTTTWNPLTVSHQLPACVLYDTELGFGTALRITGAGLCRQNANAIVLILFKSLINHGRV